MQNKKKVVTLLAGGAALVMGSSAFVAQAAPHAKISAAQANAIVLKKFPGTLTAKTTLENEEGIWQYGVMVRSGRTLREVMVNARSGKIANVETTTPRSERIEAKVEAKAEAKAEQSAARKATRHASRTSRLTTTQAENVVLRRFPGRIVEAPLEHEGGKWQYGVLVRSGHTLRDVMVNAQSGKIDSVTVTTMAKEQAEKRAEAAAKKK